MKEIEAKCVSVCPCLHHTRSSAGECECERLVRSRGVRRAQIDRPPLHVALLALYSWYYVTPPAWRTLMKDREQDASCRFESMEVAWSVPVLAMLAPVGCKVLPPYFNV